MKRAAVILAILSIAVWGQAQNSPAPAQQTPAAGQAAPAQGATPAPGTAPAAKRPPQAKTQPEFDAWKAASTSTDAAALEKAAEDVYKRQSRAPQVGDRVHHPGGMQPNYYAREYTPQQPGQSANREQDHAENYV